MLAEHHVPDDPEEFHAWFEAHRHLLLPYARMMCGRYAEAMLDEARNRLCSFLASGQRLPRDLPAMVAYVKATIRHAFFDEHRHQQKFTTLSDNLEKLGTWQDLTPSQREMMVAADGAYREFVQAWLVHYSDLKDAARALVSAWSARPEPGEDALVENRRLPRESGRQKNETSTGRVGAWRVVDSFVRKLQGTQRWRQIHDLLVEEVPTAKADAIAALMVKRVKRDIREATRQRSQTTTAQRNIQS